MSAVRFMALPLCCGSQRGHVCVDINRIYGTIAVESSALIHRVWHGAQVEFLSARLPVAFCQASLTEQEVIFRSAANENNLAFVIFLLEESSVKNCKCMTPMSTVNLKAVLLKRNGFEMCTVMVAVSEVHTLKWYTSRKTDLNMLNNYGISGRCLQLAYKNI